MSDDAGLVVAARAGQPDAFGPLVERWFDRCWEVAWRILRDRDLAADVAQDTLLTAWRQLDRLERPASFGGWVLRITRNRALDRLAQQRRSVPTADYEMLEPSVSGNDLSGPEAAFARAQQRDLVWAAAEALGERDASLLDLHLRHGLEPHELADELGIAPNAAHQALFRLRKRLGAAIRAWLLWRDDAPACVVLRAELAAAGHRTFGAATVRTIERHVRDCQACAEERERVAAPAMLFSAVPFIAPPLALRARSLRSLAESGVPVGDGGDPDGGQTPPDGASRPTSSTSRRLVGAAAVALVILAVTGWVWRIAATPVVPAVVGDAVATPSQSAAASASPPGTSPASADDAGDSLAEPGPAPPGTSTPPPDEPSAPPPAGEAPVIAGLRAVFVGRCPTAGTGRFQLVWASTHAVSATLTSADGTAEPVPASGSARRCAADGTAFTLDVTGPGGTATRTVVVAVPGRPEAPDAPDEPGEPGEPEEPEEPGPEEPGAPDPELIAPT